LHAIVTFPDHHPFEVHLHLLPTNFATNFVMNLETNLAENLEANLFVDLP
jgi:hypothetical protein